MPLAWCSRNKVSRPFSVVQDTEFGSTGDRRSTLRQRLLHHVTLFAESPSFLSGQYAHRHKVLNNFTDFPNDLSSYPAGLRASGYETAYIGKWHMGEDDDRKRPGFDFWMSHKGQGNYNDNEFNIDGTRKIIKGYYSTVVTDAATDWIKQKHTKPWLLILGHKAPHGGPITPEAKYEKAFDTEQITKPANADAYKAAGGKPKWLEEAFPTWHGGAVPCTGRRTMASSCGHI